MRFIGVGAQRSGTSWIYACLYEHPEICAPIKEIHFFSRPRYSKGIGWYIDHFSKCPAGTLEGEFSTSYLYSPYAAERIHNHFPNAKIIMSLRNPIDRAYSQYRNAIAAGEIPKSKEFDVYIREEPSAVEQGYYYEQVKRYLDLFGEEQVLTLIYEDSKKDPKQFIQSIYEFLGVAPSFTPSMIHRKINTSRTPRTIGIDRIMIMIANFLRKVGLDRLVWIVKKSGVPKKIRSVNTEEDERQITEETKKDLKEIFKEDAEKLSNLIGRDVARGWGLSN